MGCTLKILENSFFTIKWDEFESKTFHHQRYFGIKCDPFKILTFFFMFVSSFILLLKVLSTPLFGIISQPSKSTCCLQQGLPFFIFCIFTDELYILLVFYLFLCNCLGSHFFNSFKLPVSLHFLRIWHSVYFVVTFSRATFTPNYTWPEV